MVTLHGNVVSRPAIPHKAYARYVAVLDVLGMKAWLATESAQRIAERLDVALVASDQSSRGVTEDGRAYGPLISTSHFSDTLLAWSPDDSWTSLATICSAVKMIVAVALDNGVPLRGSIAVGEAVCNSQLLRFVGPPIAEAFIWAEKLRPYKSVGVDISPRTIEVIREKLRSDPLPAFWDSKLHGIPLQLLNGRSGISQTLVWYHDGLFLNHWAHGIFTGRDPRQMFNARQLPKTPEVTEKEEAMMEFFSACQTMTEVEWRTEWGLRANTGEAEFAKFGAQSAEYIRLDQVRAARAPW